MAEKQCNLLKNGGGNDKPVTFNFDVTSVSVNTAWGTGGYYSDSQTYNIGLDATNKKLFITFYPVNSYSAWPIVESLGNGTLKVQYVRLSPTTITGKLSVMILD